jgi:hypothetical protein
MNTERKQNLREKQKDRWAKFALIGEFLGYTRIQISNFWPKIQHLEQELLSGDPATKILAAEILEETLAECRKRFGQEREEHNKKIKSPLRIHKPDRADTPADELRLAMWFIGKIGDPQRAVKVVTAAAAAAKELER